MRVFETLVVVPIIVVVIGAGSAQERKVADDDIKKLQGTWSAVSIESAGGKTPKEVVKKVKFVFKDNGLTIDDGSVPDPKKKGKTFGVKSFKIDPSKTPKEIDLILADGDKRLGIYELKGDNLKMCWGIKRTRPTKLAVDPKRKDVALFVLKRQK
jgi:uncharacterized protein (TIGR03067 family)